MKQLFFLLLLSSLTAFISCDKTGGGDPVADYSAELTAAGNEVIIATYQQLDSRTEQLVVHLEALKTLQSDTILGIAQQKWRDARLPWEQAEGFLFGPVDQQGIDPAMDSWPVNVIDLEAVLASGNALTKEYLDAQEGTIKGFHTIEYLLFGENGDKKAADFTPRQFEYLLAAAESLRGETSKLWKAWQPGNGNFVVNLEKAGTTSSIYPSQKAALQELVEGMILIADEVGNGKIHDPFSQQNITLEESRFSANSKADFADNIRSLRNIYFGKTDGTVGVACLSRLVLTKNETLDSKIQTRISTAIAAIEGIPGTFTTAIFDQKPAVEAARTAVRDLQETLQSELLPFIQAL